MRFLFFVFVLIFPFIASAATQCVPVAPSKYFSAPGAPRLICRFHGPFKLYGWLVSRGARKPVIYYSTGKDARVFFRGPVYGSNGLPVNPHIVVAKRRQK